MTQLLCRSKNSINKVLCCEARATWVLQGYLIWLCAFSFSLAAQPARSPEYDAVQTGLARGWNSWDLHSVAAQVLLPEGFTIRVGLKHNSALNSDSFLSDILIGRRGKGEEVVFPGPHTWNGSYTELRVSWLGDEFLLQSAHEGQDLVMLATPLGSTNKAVPSSLVISTGVLWNRPGGVFRTGDHIEFRNESRKIDIYWTGKEQPPSAIPLHTPYFAAPFLETIGVSTGRARSVEEIKTILAQRRPVGTEISQAIESVLGWDTIYDPSQARVISPVSRLWSIYWGGFVLFDWDTFFAASLASIGNRELAYANALEILRESAPEGFVPNYARAGGWKSTDRSQPPVGAITILALYRKFHDKWILRDTFEQLFRWNRWWDQHRQSDGYLVWGTDAANKPVNPDDSSIGTLQGAKYESGLDNSPMYDDAPFDAKTGKMAVADVGLMGLYIADCRALAGIAAELGKEAESRELKERAQRYDAALQTLWDEKSGIFLNKNLATGTLMSRLSPTNFYPLLAGTPSPAQAQRMVNEHLLNPGEFWGEWVLPSISRNDAAFKDQEYWRGRVWGPMNYLVYLGMLNYELPMVRRDFAQKSLSLFNKEWTSNGHVHENYNSITGQGDDVSTSDRFYHWGALLGLIDHMERESVSAKTGPSPKVPSK